MYNKKKKKMTTVTCFLAFSKTIVPYDTNWKILLEEIKAFLESGEIVPHSVFQESHLEMDACEQNLEWCAGLLQENFGENSISSTEKTI